MRLDFNVLWVDDQPRQIEALFPAISRRMREHGFEFREALVDTIEGVRDRIGNDVFADNVDLIVIDWELRAGLRGQEVIAEIRDTVPYKDIVFYSSLTPTTELRSLAAGVGADGIYTSTKQAIGDEVMNLFDSLVKKVMDLDHSRGIVMGATSDIDQMVTDCLGDIVGKASKDEQEAIIKKAQSLVAEKIASLKKTADKLGSIADVGELLKAHALFTAIDRLRVLNERLEGAAFAKHESLRGGLKGYISDVVPMRNELGHVVFLPSSEPGVLVSLNGKKVTVDDMRTLRVTLLNLRTDFRALRDELRGTA